jgi:TatD DNase family protein
MFVETDSPYLTPVPHRGKRNEPAHVRWVAETIARVKAIPLEVVAATTTRNVQNLFKI